MKRYIVTGMPGSGKTTLIRALEKQGCAVIEEAATDIIALEQGRGNPQPWKEPGFVDAIVALQKQRQALAKAETQFYDRSPVCTYALSRYLGYPPSAALLEEIERIARDGIYQRQVFFVENLGYVTPSEARRISFADALAFEKIHREIYASCGYDCISIARGTVEERVGDVIGKLRYF